MLTIDEAFDERQALQAAKAGAYGYMLAEAIPVHLATAVSCMAAGDPWFSRRLSAKIVDEFQRLERQPRVAVDGRVERGTTASFEKSQVIEKPIWEHTHDHDDGQ